MKQKKNDKFKKFVFNGGGGVGGGSIQHTDRHTDKQTDADTDRDTCCVPNIHKNMPLKHLKKIF